MELPSIAVHHIHLAILAVLILISLWKHIDKNFWPSMLKITSYLALSLALVLPYGSTTA